MTTLMKFTEPQLAYLEILVARYHHEWPWIGPADALRERLERALSPEERRNGGSNAARPLDALVAAGAAVMSLYGGRPVYRATPAGKEMLLDYHAAKFGRVSHERIHVPGVDPEPPHRAILKDRFGVEWKRDGHSGQGWAPVSGDEIALKWSSPAMAVAGPFAGPRRRERATRRSHLTPSAIIPRERAFR